MRAVTLCLCFFVLAIPALGAQETAQAPPTITHWVQAPAAFPKGAWIAAVTGDPTKAGTFTVKLAMPPGYQIPPHFHPTDEQVRVERGTLLVGMGDKFDPAKLKPMKAGETGSLPAKSHHFAAVQGGTIVYITAMGPFAMTYVRPADDPRKQSSKS